MKTLTQFIEDYKMKDNKFTHLKIIELVKKNFTFFTSQYENSLTKEQFNQIKLFEFKFD